MDSNQQIAAKPHQARKPTPSWRLLISPPLPGDANMAMDEALLDRARHTGETVLRVYSWSEPTLSLGRHQRALGIYDAVRARDLGVGIVRRISGGRALLHHREVTYSVTAPTSEGEALRDSYDAINRILLRGLAMLGVTASPSHPIGRTPPPQGAPCFELPAAGEIVWNGRKLVGSAQVREDGALLQHGSILIDDDQPLIARLTSVAAGTPAPAATLRAALGRVPALDEVAGALFDAARELGDSGARALLVDDALLSRQQAALSRYRSNEWTWRK